MTEQREGRDSFPKRESTGEGTNSDNSGEGMPRTGETGAGEGRTQEGMAGQGTGQIKGADGERER
jgi:hypothetical protein